MRVQAPDGKVIEFPDTMSTDQVGEVMRKQYPPAQKPEAPKPAAGPTVNRNPFGLPDIDPVRALGKAQEFLRKGPTDLFRLAGKADVASGIKTPEKAERRAQQYGRFSTELAEGAATPWAKAVKAVPGASEGIGSLPALAGRLGQSTLLGGVQGTPEGPKGAAKGLGTGLLGGVTGEVLAAPLKFIQMAKAARQATADKAAFDKSMTETLNQMASQGHEKEVAALKTQWEQAVKAHEGSVEKAATKIADDFKAQIPAWKDFPSGVKGIQEMVVGRGQQALSESFDKAMKYVIETGKGTKIPLPRPAVEALGMKPKEFIDGPAGLLSIAVVDAGEAAKAALGKASKEPGAYRTVVGAIDKAGIGDPAARAEYKAGQAIIGFVDKSGALKGDNFNPQALINGMNRVKTVDELRRRGQGDVFRGPFQAARDVAPKPGKLVLHDAPKPMKVPETEVGGIKTFKNPLAAHPLATGLATEGLAHALGAKVPGLGLAGYMGAASLPKEMVTQAPLTREQLLALAKAAGLTGTGVRSGLDNLLFNPTK